MRQGRLGLGLLELLLELGDGLGVSDGRVVQIAEGLNPGDVIVSDARQDVAVGTRVNAVFAR